MYLFNIFSSRQMGKTTLHATLFIFFMLLLPATQAQQLLNKVEEVEREDKSGVLVYFSKAKAFYDFGKYDWAARDWGYLLENFHKIDTALINHTGLDSVDVLYLRANSYNKLGEVKLAIADYETINKLVPNDSIFTLNCVRVYFDNHLCEEAVALIDSTAHNYEELYDAAQCYIELKEYDKALIFADKAIEHEPENYLGYRVKGKAYLELGEQDNACNFFYEAILKLRESESVPQNKKGHMEEVLLRERGQCK